MESHVLYGIHMDKFTEYEQLYAYVNCYLLLAINADSSMQSPIWLAQLFCFQEAELRLVKFLPEILTLQRDLVKRFQNLPEVELTIGDFLNSVSSGKTPLSL